MQAHAYQQVNAGNTGGACAGDDKFYIFEFLINDTQAIINSSGSNNSRAMLVVVEYRNLHALAEFFLNHKAFGCLDIFKVNTTKGGFQRGDNVYQLIDISLVHFNIKHINIGKLFKQDSLAFHYRFRGQWANIAQPQYRSTIGNDRNQIASRGNRGHGSWVFDNQLTGMSHTWRIG